MSLWCALVFPSWCLHRDLGFSCSSLIWLVGTGQAAEEQEKCSVLWAVRVCTRCCSYRGV